MEHSPFFEQINYHFGHKPNAGQEKLFHELEDFLRARNLSELMIVRGYAGTGKTSVLAAFVKTLDHYKVKCKLMAPTGRAAKVMSAMSGKTATTIHKGIYWRKSKSDLNSPFTRKPNLNKNTVFLVDEASMIGAGGIDEKTGLDTKDLLFDLVEHVYQGEGCQLILIGDVGQLPPVGSRESPALNSEYIRYQFPRLGVRELSLTEVHRQALESSILYNATKLRQEDSEIAFELRSSELQRIQGNELQDHLESAYDNFGRDNVLLINRSNKAANEYNKQIRARILWYEEELCAGEDLMVVKNNYFWQNESSNIDFIANGELIQVLRVRKEEFLYGFKFYQASIRFKDNPDFGDLDVILHAETLNVEGPNLNRERMKELFFEVEKDYLHIKSKKERYEEILKNPYFNALQVKYAYAVTCHKAQGGQWDCVFIDQGYLTDDMIDAEYKRWLYTALTRAKKQAYLLNFNEDFFTQSR